MNVYGREEFNALFAGLQPPTDDDVSITADGRRLDTPEKVLAFLEEINAERAARAADAASTTQQETPMGMAEKSRRLVEDGNALGCGWARAARSPRQVPATSAYRSMIRRGRGDGQDEHVS